MAKFKVLKKNQIFLDLIGIHLDPPTNPTWGFFTYFLNYHIPISQIICFIISFAFLVKYPNEIKPALSAVKICVAMSQCAGMFLGVRMKVIKAKALQDELQQIVNKGRSIFFPFQNSLFFLIPMCDDVPRAFH